MLTEKRKDILKLIFSISILVLLLIFICIMMIKYEVEGETNMPYKLTKIVIIGTVEGEEKNTENKTKWNFDIYQNNDIYFYIDKNEKNKNEDELIKSVKIDNIKIEKEPEKGNIKIYMPNSEQGRTFSYDEQFIVNEKLEYTGANGSSYTNLQIGSKGGSALIRFSNTNIGNYSSDIDEEIIHNSTLLKKIETANEQISFEASFDLTIETTIAKYKTNIRLGFPTNNLDEEENCYFEKNDMKDVIFKRIR